MLCGIVPVQKIFAYSDPMPIPGLIIYTLSDARNHKNLFLFVLICLYTGLPLKVWPGYGRYKPISSVLQIKFITDTDTTLDTGCVLYLPTAHNAHVPSPSNPVVPALHVHTFEIEPATAELFPVPHTVHGADPGAIL